MVRLARAERRQRRKLLNQVSANIALTIAAPGFFNARTFSPWLQPSGTIEATSSTDTAELRRRSNVWSTSIGSCRVDRASVRSSQRATGNFSISTTKRTDWTGAHHGEWSASPGFPAVEIEGEYYWDGGLVSNTPLQWVLETSPVATLSRSKRSMERSWRVSRTMPEVMTRRKRFGTRAEPVRHSGIYTKQSFGVQLPRFWRVARRTEGRAGSRAPRTVATAKSLI